jgi:hypothetical protein
MANITIVETGVPLGSLLATTLEPKEELDANELVFTPSAWCCPIGNVLTPAAWCPITNVPHGVTTVTHIPRPGSAKDEDDDCKSMPLLLTRRDDYSSVDEDEDEDDIGHFDDDENKAVSSGLYIIPPAQESMTTYLKLILLAGLALSITSVQGRVNNAMNAISLARFSNRCGTPSFYHSSGKIRLSGTFFGF